MIRKFAELLLVAATACVLILPEAASAQSRGGERVDRMGGDRMREHGGHGWRGTGMAIGIVTGILANTTVGRPGEQTEKPKKERSAKAPRNSRRGGSGVPPAGERRLVPDEIVIELPNTMSAATIDAVARRHRLTRLDSQSIALLGTTFNRWRIPDRRSVAAVVRALEADRRVASAQPNYLFTLQQAETKPAAPSVASYGDPAQYAVSKMRLSEAHGIAKGGEVRVAVIDSGIDPSQPELKGTIVETLDTLKVPFKPHSHGTGIAALIAGHGRLMGSAPEARILGVRAFDPSENSAEATTFNIIKGLDWSVTQGARIINMSFAGPADPAIRRALEAADKKGVVLIAAAGNAGEKSPPLYPAAEPVVIAVTATDGADNLFKGSNRGRHVAVAAPGVDILIAVPDGGYEVSTGTSYSAAEVSGIAALMIQRKPDLTPAAVRAILLATAKDLGKKGRDDDFGAGLADAYRAVTEVPGALVSDAVPAK